MTAAVPVAASAAGAPQQTAPAHAPPVRLVTDRPPLDSAQQRLQWLCEQITRNRFLPLPPAELLFVGDGDFRAIGAEFLRYFVTDGGLRPNEEVLEIGCGIGRMAVPLTQYLSETGAYQGIDVVQSGIDWCRQNVTSRYPSFQFHHLDLQHPIYNPGGSMAADKVQLPFADKSFDFILLTSVVTHLSTMETRAYAGEIARLLRPRGRCFLSLFLIDDEARHQLRQGQPRLPFDVGAEGPEYQAHPDHPGGAVAYDETFFLRLFAEHGLQPNQPVQHGHWSGRAASNYQDICVLGKVDAGPL